MPNAQYSTLNNYQYPDYHSISAYQRAKSLIKLVISLSEKLPQTRAFDAIFLQLVRSTSSIGANIAEGYGRNNVKEYRQFLGIARGSSLETEYWLETLQETTKLDLLVLLNLNKEIIKLLTTTVKNVRGPS